MQLPGPLREQGPLVLPGPVDSGALPGPHTPAHLRASCVWPPTCPPGQLFCWPDEMLTWRLPGADLPHAG